MNGYQLYSRDLTKNAYSLIYDGSNNPSIMNYRVKNLLKGSIFSFKFLAINRVGKSNFSPELSSISVSGLPGKANTPILFKFNSTQITLNFMPNSDDGGSPILNYNLYRDTGDSSSNFSLVKAYINNSLSYIFDSSLDNTLTLGKIYRFLYSANNSNGEGLKSDELKVALASLPSKPTTPTVNIGFSSQIALRVEWASITLGLDMAISFYNLYMDDGNSGKFILTCQTNINNSIQFCIVSTVSGKKYRFYVTASNFNGEGINLFKEGPMSDILYSYSCVYPSNFNTPYYNMSTNSSIFISWLPPQNNGGCPITGYEIYMNNADGTFPSLRVDQSLTQNLPSLLQYNIKNLTNLSATYMFMINAINSVGRVSSGVLSVVLCSLPNAPSTSPIRNDNNTSQNFIIININPFALSDSGGCPIVSYEIERDDGVDGPFVTLFGFNPFSLSTSYLDKNIILGSTYKYIYRARNLNGWSPFSYPSYIKALVAPNQPNQPLINSFSTTAISIQISPLINYMGSSTMTYEIWMNSGSINTNFSNLSNYNGNSLTYVITALDGLLSGMVYSIRVRAKNEAGMYSPFRYF